MKCIQSSFTDMMKAKEKIHEGSLVNQSIYQCLEGLGKLTYMPQAYFFKIL